jgi:hypothetical protein
MNTTSQRLAAAAIAAFAVVSAIPIPLVGLDFAGFINVFHIDGGDIPQGVLTIVAGAAILTIAVLLLACVGIVLALTGSRAARPVLLVAAAAGIVTAVAAWLPAGVLLGVAAHLVDKQAPENLVRAQGHESQPHRVSEPAQAL